MSASPGSSRRCRSQSAVSPSRISLRSWKSQVRIMLTHHYESAGRHQDAQAIAQEMLSAQPEMTAERGVERLARFWKVEWIPEDLEEQLRSAGLP